MTDEQKAIIDEAAAEAVAWQREQSATLEEEAKAAFRENGVDPEQTLSFVIGLQ